ncbi:unnamed protein product [Schistosoma mattheei]|uniref:Uncharacterized protein n=1 Tax=Schistosoma mattheei TaxID=31246 RepID=A0A183NZK8_9TREM|nr:unnamed protein product [Schistosoma mattheei]
MLVGSCIEFQMLFSCKCVALALPIRSFTSATDPPCSSMMLLRYVEGHISECDTININESTSGSANNNNNNNSNNNISSTNNSSSNNNNNNSSRSSSNTDIIWLAFCDYFVAIKA